MTTKLPTQMTEEATRTLAEKMQTWAETLDPKEQAVLGEVFRRAAGDEAVDMAGHGGWSTLWYSLAVVVEAASKAETGGSQFADDLGPKI
jgi:hypothetical protein